MAKYNRNHITITQKIIVVILQLQNIILSYITIKKYNSDYNTITNIIVIILQSRNIDSDYITIMTYSSSYITITKFNSYL